MKCCIFLLFRFSFSSATYFSLLSWLPLGHMRWNLLNMVKTTKKMHINQKLESLTITRKLGEFLSYVKGEKRNNTAPKIKASLCTLNLFLPLLFGQKDVQYAYGGFRTCWDTFQSKMLRHRGDLNP